MPMLIPGWLKTFKAYYEDQVRHILDVVVSKLTANPKQKFIFAEVSFLALWWEEQTWGLR